MTTHTASGMVEDIINQCPQTELLFKDPRFFERQFYSRESNLIASDDLMEIITLIFQMNDLDFTLRHFPGKGWAAGCEFPSGIEDMEFEAVPDEQTSQRFPGHAMLSLLWSMVVQCRWNPVVMERRDWCARVEPVRKMRIEP